MAYENAFAIGDSNGDIDDKGLAGLPVDGVEDRASLLHRNSASNTQTVGDAKRSIGKESLTVPGVEEGDDDGENTMWNPPATGTQKNPKSS